LIQGDFNSQRTTEIRKGAHFIEFCLYFNGAISQKETIVNKSRIAIPFVCMANRDADHVH